MDDLFKRGCLAFAGASAGIFFVALAMVENGSAQVANPAWQLVSFLRDIFIWPWVLLLGAWAVYVVGMIISKTIALICKSEPAQTEVGQDRSAPKSRPTNYVYSPSMAVEYAYPSSEQTARREQERQEQVKRETERKQSRSSAQAVDEALNEF